MWFELGVGLVLGFIIYKLIGLYFTYKNGYWRKLGVPVALPTEFASAWALLLGKARLTDLDLFYYNKYKDAPFVGFMEFGKPGLQIRDLELIKRIFIKDFEHFVDRRTFDVGDETSDKFLFNMKGQEWKDMRSTMSPTFATTKIRKMFPHFDKSMENLVQYVKVEKGRTGKEEIELREIFGRYTMDVIAATAFGIESNCLVDDESMFLKMGRRIQKFDLVRVAKTMLMIFAPVVGKALGLSVFDRESTDFFKHVIRRSMAARLREGGGYADFLSALVEVMKGKEESGGDESESLDTFEKDAKIETATKKKIYLSDMEIVANSLSLFFGGFDTTESFMTLATYNLALHPEIQEKIRAEVREILKEFDGKVTYDAVMRMSYLDMFMSEVLRLYPVAPRTERKVTKSYKVAGSELILPVGTLIAIPIYGIHLDEKYFPEPTKFDPERFSLENKQKRHPYAYMPFGHGPRGCIGMRFALIEAKVALAQLVKTFDIIPCQDTFIPLKLDDSPGNIKAAKGLKVRLRLRN